MYVQSALRTSGGFRTTHERQRPLPCVVVLAAGIAIAITLSPQAASWIAPSAIVRPISVDGRRSLTTCGAYTGKDVSLPLAHAELGLEDGAELRDVKRVFRKLARENHPDLCTDEEQKADAAARFASIKFAYDDILKYGFGEKGAPPIPKGVGQKVSDGFKTNMAMGRGHHKISDGRLYELWLDFRGPNGGERMDNARMEVMQMFFKVRSLVDEMGVSLLKEGTIRGFVVDHPDDMDDPESIGAKQLKRAIASWDFKWQPLFLVKRSEDGRYGLWDAKNNEFQGWLRQVVDGPLLARVDDEQTSSEPDFTQDLVIAATSAKQAELAQVRYGFAMRALVLPAEPAPWAVAAAQGCPPDKADSLAAAFAAKTAV